MPEPNRGHSNSRHVLAGDARATHFRAENVDCTLGDRRVLWNVTLTVASGERVGLIGENGRGKSTLLRVLAGELPAQGGEVSRAITGTVGFLPQRPGFPPGASIADVVAEATAGVRSLADRMRAAEAAMATGSGDLDQTLREYGRLQEEFTERGGWELDARTGEVLNVFGLGAVPSDRHTDQLSGGQRARLALAALVLAEPAGLLLDEPTNHLDDRAVDWLVRWLADYRGPCLIASHDRVLLDDAVTAIVDLDGPQGEVVRYGGNYRDYLGERTAAHARWRQRYRDWRAELTEARRRLDRAGAGRAGPGMRDNNKLAYNAAGSAAEAAIARSTRAARQHLRQLVANAVPSPPEPLTFAPPDSGGPARGADDVLLRAEALVVGAVLRGVDVTLRPGSRHVITGRNGAGKSTLLAVLAGTRAAESGVVAREPGVRIGYLPQETDFGRERRGVLDTFAAHRAAHREDAAAELSRFGLFTSGDFDVPVDRLSVGQRRRLALALLFAARPHLLLLDEPTNHLSLVLVEQFQDAIERFAGPVVLVTHDRALRRRCADQVLELVDGRLSGPCGPDQRM